MWTVTALYLVGSEGFLFLLLLLDMPVLGVSLEPPVSIESPPSTDEATMEDSSRPVI